MYRVEIRHGPLYEPESARGSAHQNLQTARSVNRVRSEPPSVSQVRSAGHAGRGNDVAPDDDAVIRMAAALAERGVQVAADRLADELMP